MACIGVLSVTVEAAKDLKTRGWGKRHDPYCCVTVGSQTVQTKPATNSGSNPKWNETLPGFYLTANVTTARVEIKDGGPDGKDDLFGTASMSLNRVCVSGRDRFTIPILTANNGKKHGELWVSLSLAPYNPPAMTPSSGLGAEPSTSGLPPPALVQAGVAPGSYSATSPPTCASAPAPSAPEAAGLYAPGQPYPAPAPGQPYPAPGQPYPAPGQPYSAPVPGQPYSAPVPGQPYSAPVPGQPYPAPAPGQPYPAPAPGQPYLVPGQPYSAPAPGQPYSAPAPGQPYPAPGQPYPNAGQPYPPYPPPQQVPGQRPVTWDNGMLNAVVVKTFNGMSQGIQAAFMGRDAQGRR